MSFLSPVFLLGLPLAAIPVLIHFFSRKQRNPIRWGAMDFLMTSTTPRRSFLRLRDLPLMLLRLALFLAIIAALAQPMISSGWLGATGPRDVVLILDNSMSTARRLGAATVFDRELDEAAKILRQLKPSDVARVLLTSPAPEWIADTPAAGGSGNLRDLEQRLGKLKPTEGSADLLDCAQMALQAEPVNKNVSRFVTVLTDGQAHGWRAETPSAWSAINALVKKSALPVSMHVIVPDGAGAPAENLAVEKLTATRAVVGVGQPVTLTASIRNTGSQPSEATSLAWSTREESLGLSTVPALAAGAGTTVSMSQPFSAAGVVEVTCKLAAPDDLPPDNTARFLLEVTPSIPVLVVQGEPQSDPTQSDTEFFLAALGYNGEGNAATAAASIFHPKLINYGALAKEDLSAYQCIVLADVPRLPAGSTQKLMNYVNSGGGLWVALGEQTDIKAFNQGFFETGAGLAPLPLRQPVGDADDHDKFIGLSPPSPDHPATAMLADTHRLDIDRVRIYRRHQFDTDSSATMTILFRAEGGAPVAVERDMGRGRVVVQTIPLGLRWSNLPLCHAYVVMAREWLWYLTEPGLVKRNLRAGELLQAVEPVEVSNGGASLQLPSGRVAQLFGQEEDGRLIFRYPRTQSPGEYSLSPVGGKESKPEKFLVSRDPEESNLTPLTKEQISLISATANLEFGGDPLFQPSTQKIAAPPRALAMWLFAALILLMAAELAVAWWLARRRRQPAPGIVMEPGIRA